MLTSVLLYSGIFVAGIVAGLQVIAPRLNNATLNKVLVYAEDVEKVIEGLGGQAAATAQGVTVLPATAKA